MYKQTFFFIDIFPTYEKFKEVTDALELYTLTDEAKELFNEKCYDLLVRKYAKNSVAYQVPEDFIFEFSLAYEENFEQFFKKTEISKAIKGLSVEDFKLIGESISNSALNPNTTPTNPKSPLNYVSSQLYSISNSAPLIAYLNALNAIPTVRIYEFLDKFEYLFLQIYTKNTPIFYN